MKKIFYFVAWLFLTASDWILGYRTAVSDFGITEPLLAIIWAGGFSMMSVPIKLMYDRLIEQPFLYEKKYGTPLFVIFSIVWLIVFFQAFHGISDLRKRDLQREELKILQIEPKNQEITKDTSTAKNRYDFRLLRDKLKNQAKTDSMKLAFEQQQQSEITKKRMELVSQSTINGFLYFNILLILSAGICLSLAFAENKLENVEIDIEEDIVHGTPNFEITIPPAIETEPVIQEYVEEKEVLQYECQDCKVMFKNRQSYNSHFKNNTTCQKLNFVKHKQSIQ